jgi:hypothetical protein
VGGDFVFDQNAESLVASQTIDRETYTRILELSGSQKPDDILMGHILKLVFLVNKLPAEGNADTKLRATAQVLADLLLEDLNEDTSELRRRVPVLLDALVQRHALMEIQADRGMEYRLQTGESAEWYEEFGRQESALRASASTVAIKRDQFIHARLEKDTRGLTFLHGESREPRKPRKPELRFDAALPADYRKKLSVWVRDGSLVTQTVAANEARALDRDSPAIVLHLPDEKSNELFNAIVAAEAAQATINIRWQPGTPAGAEARKSVESRLAGALQSINQCLDAMVDGVRIWLAGGSEVANGIGIRELLERALEAAVGRLYPRFAEADFKAWDKVLVEARKGNGEALSYLGYNGEPADHPVCRTVLDTIGAEKTGSTIRELLSSPPFGWSKDAIDSALWILLAVDRVMASDAGNHTLGVLRQNLIRWNPC